MTKFANKGAVVEAVQLLPENWAEIVTFAGVGSLLDGKPTGTRINNRLALLIPNRDHGVLTAFEGDWLVIEDGQLDFYSPDAFAKTYQPVVTEPA